jgi:hypothetical protein
MALPIYLPEDLPDLKNGVLIAHVYTQDPLSVRVVDRGIQVISRNSPLRVRDGHIKSLARELTSLDGVFACNPTNYASSGNLSYRTRIEPLTRTEIYGILDTMTQATVKRMFDSMTCGEMVRTAYRLFKLKLGEFLDSSA